MRRFILLIILCSVLSINTAAESSGINKNKLKYFTKDFPEMNRSEKEPEEIQEDAYNEIVDNAQSELDSHNEHADSIYDESIVHHINIRQYDDKMKNFNARRDMEMIIITDKGIKADSCEPNDTFSTAYPIAYHDTLTDCAINPAGDLDFFRFSGTAGDTIIIDIDAYAYGSSLDPYIYLYDTDSSTVLASNDDNDGLDSKIEFYVLPSTGTYFIKVREYSHPNQGGSDYWYDIALFDTFRVTGALSGTITDQYGNPLENIDLDIYTENDGYVSNSAYTDSNGYYIIDGLEPGNYKVNANPYYTDGYIEEYYDNKIYRDSADIVTVYASDTTEYIDFTLETGGCISGIVIDQNYNPVPNVYIDVYDCYTGNYITSAYSASDGSYTVNSLYDGSFKLQTYPPSSTNYLSEFYDNKTSYAEADSVFVTVPDTVNNINFILEEGGAISGTITDDYGNPIEGIDLDIYDANNNWVSSNDYSDSLGNYTLNKLRTGYYKVMADLSSSDPYLDEYYNNRASLDSADLVYVSALDTTTGIDFQLETGGAITGTITDEYGNPIEDIYLHVYDVDNNWMSSYDYSDSLGNYTLNKLRTGYYKVMADPSSSDPYFDEYYNNRASLDSADLVYVSSPDTTTGIDFILNTGGCISGTITDESGNPIEGIDMDIYDENDNWVSSNDYSDSLGYYCLTNLRTGYYKVLADAGMGSGYVFEYYNDKTSMSDADLVYVSESDTTADIDFILEEGNKITGTVYDESNEPIPNFIIYTFDAASGEVITAVLTDSLGQYVLQTLPTVYLKIMAMPVTWSSTPDTIHAFEWYGDAGTFENADSLNLNTSDSLGGIDFYIENAGRIAGTVYKNQTNNIIQGADVFGWYYLNDYYGWVDFFIDTTDSMGNYTLYNQRTGNYRVSAYKDSFEYQWYELAADTNDLDLVSVTMPNTTTGIDFYLNSFYPDITVSPDSISVNLITDAVYNKSIKISNIGGDTLEFTVGDDASWLGVSPTSGIVGSQEYSSIAVEFNTAGLTTGNYSATITVFSNDADESTIDIPVNLTVVEAIYVYPGDTDNDGKVSASDILPIGRFWHYSGAPRDSISTQWQAKRATPWSPEQGATYTDCDGDGSVDIDDVLAIGTNWRKTHTKKAGEYVFKLSGENTHRYIDNYKDIYTSLKGNGEAVREMKTLLQGIINGSPAEYFMKNNMLENTADKTVIRFGLPKQTDVTLKVYNITGSRIATLVNETLEAGYYSRTLNTSDLGPGVYLYRMEADGFVETKKIILVK